GSLFDAHLVACGQDKLTALPGEGLCNGAADAASGSCNDRGSAFQAHLVHLRGSVFRMLRTATEYAIPICRAARLCHYTAIEGSEIARLWHSGRAGKTGNGPEYFTLTDGFCG